MGGFPCQSVSVCGKQEGFIDKEGNKTRSGLYYDGLRILQYNKPKYSVIENVKGLTQTKFKEQFKQILIDLDKAGYNNYWEILNAKDYGIPQNRERIYIVSIRKDIDKNKFKFPEPLTNNKKLTNVLEKNVSEKHFIKQEKVNKLLTNSNINISTDIDEIGILIDRNKVRIIENDKATCIDANYWKGLDNHAQRTGILHLKDVLEPDARLPILHNIYGGFNECKPRIFNEYSPAIRTARGGGHIPSVCTIDISKVEKIIGEYRIRKLTPLECFRLMGFDDKDYYILKNNNISDTQIYKMAGNSIVVNVLEEIFKNLFK